MLMTTSEETKSALAPYVVQGQEPAQPQKIDLQFHVLRTAPASEMKAFEQLKHRGFAAWVPVERLKVARRVRGGS
jgi:hypothetical protein